MQEQVQIAAKEETLSLGGTSQRKQVSCHGGQARAGSLLSSSSCQAYAGLCCLLHTRIIISSGHTCSRRDSRAAECCTISRAPRPVYHSLLMICRGCQTAFQEFRDCSVQDNVPKSRHVKQAKYAARSGQTQCDDTQCCHCFGPELPQAARERHPQPASCRRDSVTSPFIHIRHIDVSMQIILQPTWPLSTL